MSMQVARNEHGLIRVFRLSDSLAAAQAESGDFGPLESALGVIIAEPADVQIVSADSLRGMGLKSFLNMAYDIDEAALAAMPALSATGDATIAVIRSGAFGGAEVTLADSPDASLVATLQEDGPAAASMAPLQSEAAKGTISDPPAKPAKSDARVGGMVATLVLLVLFALVALMIWIAA